MRVKDLRRELLAYNQEDELSFEIEGTTPDGITEHTPIGILKTYSDMDGVTIRFEDN